MFIDSEWKQEIIKPTKFSPRKILEFLLEENETISKTLQRMKAKNGESIFITNDHLVYDHNNSFKFSDTYFETLQIALGYTSVCFLYTRTCA